MSSASMNTMLGRCGVAFCALAAGTIADSASNERVVCFMTLTFVAKVLKNERTAIVLRKKCYFCGSDNKMTTYEEVEQ